MALENWNEFSETVVNYVEQLTASEDPDDMVTANMAKKWITKGTISPRDQVRLSKSIKDLLADYSDSPLNGRRGGSRASGVARLSAEDQALWASMVGMDVLLSAFHEDAYNYHTTFAGKKEDGVPISSWGSNEIMIRNVLINKLESGFVSAHKGDN